MWKITHTRNDGRHVYRKNLGNAWAIIWDYPGIKDWAVYVGDGNNEVCSGKSASMMLAKSAANLALKRATDGNQ